ncbi:Ubiquinol-cytochrome C reductase iron-sulfur subunit [Thioalkalivibrio nitratireducens DSM 14787]|uniref:Ubiquinol-cytochrome c reductase iron-sulfur subunit n=1 Tax=Thioalkalivibrio nitratireducens (strain DSM 14787 / UNIQEM 213 / ALEN2) TaxID=1255043 RepID=L0DYY7_THIND|nr:ubiquinol-cytochrome c reductase iron-sulfur subunit [Thioalkalivibrio nitratireducens]AGA34263.1 Ubiquinol-cytochrome C reductase iron-sulfur subunit [Thioalkalivibrio nitratireducens DSM 14787]
MADQGVDRRRRRFLVAATTVVGGAGVAALAVPFVASLQPSARAQAAGAPVEVNVTQIEPGQRISVAWRGRPVWVVRRTPEMLELLPEIHGRLRDPDSEVAAQQPEYAQNTYRSIKPEILVLIGLCTHLGCSPAFRPEIGAAELGSDWPGGWFCGCHGSRFDMAGRVYRNMPAALNLEVPPHRYLSDDVILVGEHAEGGTA